MMAMSSGRLVLVADVGGGKTAEAFDRTLVPAFDEDRWVRGC